MKSCVTTSVGIILLVVAVGAACAFDTDFDDLNRFDRSLPGWKLGRGLMNFLTSPYELFTNMANAAIDGGYYGAYDGGLQGYLAGSTNGMIAGSFTGAYLMAKRATTGLLEMATFWKPEYGPTLEPEYGTRFRGDPFYFDPEPFWYVGPPRF